MKNLFKITYVRIYSLLGILVFSFTSSVTLHGQTVAELQTEIDNIEAGSGLEANGAYSADSSTNYLGQATSLKNADDRLDEALNTEATARSTADNEIERGAGLEADGSYSADSSTNFLTEATSLKNADYRLD